MAELAFVVTAANREYRNCPVSVPVNPAKLPAGALFVGDGAGVCVPAQVESLPGSTRLHWIIPYLAAGQTALYTVFASDSLASPPVALVKREDRVEVRIGESEFTSYYFGPEWSKPFLHPLRTPAGAATRRWPMEEAAEERHDHVHHKGCYVAHGDVNGADLWSEEKNHGRIVHQDFVAVESGPVYGRLLAENHWLARDGHKQMTEHREYRFYNLPAAARAFDLTVRFVADAGPVVLGDTKEGGICSVRVATSMDASGAGCFVNGYGAIREKEAWGKRAPWCAYYGPVGKEIVGVAIFDHPTSFRYPTWWHVRDYGLMTANPFGWSHYDGHPDKEPLGTHEIPDGGELVFRYRVLVHLGNPWQARVGEQYHHWVNPPTIKGK